MKNSTIIIASIIVGILLEILRFASAGVFNTELFVLYGCTLVAIVINTNMNKEK